MKMPPTKKGMYFGVLIILSIIVVLNGIIYYHSRRITHSAEITNQLYAISQPKRDRIAEWYLDELHDAKVIASNSFLQTYIKQCALHSTFEQCTSLKKFLFNLIEEHGYDAIFLATINGDIITSTTQQPYLDSVAIVTIASALKQNQVTSTDIYRTQWNNSVVIDFIAPLPVQVNQRSYVLIFRRNPVTDLYPLIIEWPIPTKTAETILLRREQDSIVFLNELRHKPNTLLSKISTQQISISSVQEALEHHVLYEGTDYRNIKVLAFLTPIQGTPWFLVTKIDRDEAYERFRSENRAMILIIIFIIVTIAAAIAFFYSYRQQNLYRKAWQAETEFRTTLYSIGDAVITTDRNSFIQNMNPVAEALTGWSETEARGKKIEEVFHILNEDTHTPVLNPVSRVLSEGMIIGLANHTVLLSKDGREIPIADSGAPIKDKNGVVTGVVLVFRDQTKERHAQRALQGEKDFAESIIATLQVPLLVLDEHFNIITANRAFYSSNECSLSDILQKNIFDIQNKRWDRPELRSLLLNELSQNKSKKDVEVKIGNQIFRFNAQHIYREGNNTNLILLAIEDMTERRKTEENIRTSEAKFRSIFSVIPDVFLVLDSEGRYVEILPANPQLLYKPANEVIGKTLYEVFPPEQAEQFMAAVTACFKSQKNVSLDYALNIEGKQIWFNGTIVPFENDKVILIARDISERKRIEQELRESEEWFRRLADTTSTAIVIYQGKYFVYVNKAACELFGYTSEELLSMQFWDAIHPDHKDLVRQRGLARQTGEVVPSRYEFKIVRKDGSIRWIDFTAGKIDWYGAPAGLGSAVDITDRKLAEEELWKRERSLTNLLSNIPGFTYRCANDKNWTMLFISEGCKEVTGYEPNDFINNKTLAFNDIIQNDYQEILWMQWQEKLPKHEVFEFEYPIITKSGEQRWVWERGRGVYDSNGSLLFIEGFITDVTNRKKAEKELTQERTLLRTIINNLPDAIYVKDTNAKKILANKVDVQNIGAHSEEEVLGKDDFAFFPPDIAKAFYNDDMYVLRTGNPIINHEEKIQFADGSVGYLLTSKVPLRDSTGKIVGIVGIGHNITEWKRAEEALRKSEAIYKEFVENDLTGDFIASSDGIIKSCNSAFAKIFGFPSSTEAQGISLSSLFPSPENFQRLLTFIKEQKRLEYYETSLKSRDRREVYVVMNIVGKTDEDGKLTEIIGYVFDDTRRHELEKQIIQTQKMESIGILAGGIAHDFNNILGIILGYTSLLEQESEKQQISAKNLEIIRKAVERGAALVRQILTFARQTDIHAATLNINDIIKELYQMLYETFPRIIEIKTILEPDLLPVIGDQTQLHQAILNLAVNAKDAMPQGGTLTFKTSNVDGNELRRKFPNATAEQYVCVSVQDTGYGIPEEDLKKIFEPFYTTKERGKGTGLGLAVVYGVVTTHQGFIDVESIEGKGTTFSLYLPVSELYELQQTEIIEAESYKGTGSILLVEDEDALREIAANVLESGGYTVFPAADGEEALRIFDEHMDTIDIVLTDLGLPKMDGTELIRRLVSKKPTLKTIVGSGYFEPQKKEELQALGVQLLLQKPYKPQELLSGVYRIITHS
jgi:PAS domain S-box-containing protein